MIGRFRSVLVALASLVALLAAFGGNLSRIFQWEPAGPLAVVMLVAKPEILLGSLAIIFSPWLARHCRQVVEGWHAAKGNFSWLPGRLRTSIFAWSAVSVIFLALGGYQAYFYAVGKYVGWTFKGRGLSSLAHERFESGRADAAVELLQFCVDYTDSRSCEVTKNDLDQRLALASSVGRLIEMAPYNPIVFDGWSRDEFFLSGDLELYERRLEENEERYNRALGLFETAISQARESASAASHTFRRLNSEAPGFGFAHRFEEALSSEASSPYRRVLDEMSFEELSALVVPRRVEATTPDSISCRWSSHEESCGGR